MNSKRRTDTQKIGKMGELAALEYLLKKGYELVAQNYRSRYGEIDIIVKDSEYIVFVEVKTRNDRSEILPCEAVDKRKQKRIIMTTEMYLAYNQTDLQPRFDVIEVWYNRRSQSVTKMNHIESAFIQEEEYTYD